MKPLTKKQQEYLDAITAGIRRGLPPTRRELCAEFGVSFNSVQQNVEALARKKYIRVERKKGRAITLLTEPPRGIPLLTLETIALARYWRTR